MDAFADRLKPPALKPRDQLAYRFVLSLAS